MAVAAFLLVLSCSPAPVQPGIVPHDQCSRSELQRFDGATMAEIENCATMADALQLMGRQATCEVVPMADVQPAAVQISAPTRSNLIF